MIDFRTDVILNEGQTFYRYNTNKGVFGIVLILVV